MTIEQLEKAIKTKNEIKKLKDFIWYAERVWTGKIIKETSRYMFKSSAYGTLDSQKYELDTEMKNRVLDVLRGKLSELYYELDKI